MEVAKFADSDEVYELNIQIKNESWDLIRKLPRHMVKLRLENIQFFLSEAYGEIEEDDDFSKPDLFETIEKVFQILDYVEESVYDVFSDDFLNLYQCHPNNIISLLGMAGIGKTTLARQIFEDPAILCYFDHRVWVTLVPNYQSENILADIFAQIDSDVDITQLIQGDEVLPRHLSIKAWDRRNLIVLDDICSVDPIEYLGRLNNNIRGEILLTTRLKEVAELKTKKCRLASFEENVYQMRLLTKEESWNFLSEKVFAEKSFPRELEKAGKMIAEECEGLPLMIATVASILSENERTLEFWTKVAMKQTSVFEDAYDIVSEKLYPTYEYLLQSMKPYFLYMAVFPLRYKVPTSKFLKLMKFERIDDCSRFLQKKCLRVLVSRSLLLERKTSSQLRIKTSSLHSVYWYLCRNVARKTKFFHVLIRFSDGLEESIKSQRRLCIQNNVLFGMKDVYNSMASNLRSLLCTGPPHPHQMPLCLGSRLLGLLDALTLRFYEFPVEVVHLLLLRYIGITYDGKLPPSISKLWNLECLIVHRHLHTKLRGAPLYLPNEIWAMTKLKHLQVMGSHLPDPCCAVLPKLETLLDVSPQSVMEGVLLGTPMLMKLGIRIELAPDASEPMFIFDHLEHVRSLESLKCAIVNPELRRSGIVSSPPIVISFLQNLKKLSLSGFGYPWEFMSRFTGLPNLKVLKLRSYAFRGPEWVIHEGEFRWLIYLLVKDSDVEYVKIDDGDGWFNCLRRLIFRHCYKLKEFPCDSRDCELEVEIVDCATSASKNIQGVAQLHSSWEE